jgi:hypothetical protein
MKKICLALCCLTAVVLFAACGTKKVETQVESAPEPSSVPEYEVINSPQIDLAAFPVDKDGYIVLFDGKSMNGWRGYGREDLPSRWVIENDCIKLNGANNGEAQDAEGGDIIFAHQFKNFELSVDWKISAGGNSGIFYLGQEIKTKKQDGSMQLEPIYISAPESQVLDNDKHPDAKLGVDGNRQSSSLYDMIPAKPQNAKPAGEWNNTTIMVYKGTVVHYQNGEKVLEYHLWTPQWTEMLQASKFSETAWPLAFALLNNCGGENHEGYIGVQDHGDDVWYKNIRIKLMD